MKKPVLSLLFSIVLFSAAEAQLRTAIAGGAHLSSVSGTGSLEWDSLQHPYSSRKGFHAGLLVETPLAASNHLYLRTGMMYSNKGRVFASSYDSTTGPVSAVSGRQWVNYMEIPFVLMYKGDIGKGTRFFAGAGPSFSFLFSGKESTVTHYSGGGYTTKENTSLKVARSEGSYQNLDIGIQAVAGIEFGRLFVNAHFNRGLTDFYRAHHNNGSFRNQVAGITAGIYLSSERRKDRRERDRDKDGIPDRIDACPKLPGSIATDGCPDRDNDGVADKDDSCPTLPGSPARKGCPVPDSDGDGVNDDEDKCPTEKGTADLKGCPESENSLNNLLAGHARNIQFRYKSTSLSIHSVEVLDEIVKILRRNPKMKVLIEGYTSSDGNGKNHQTLSQRRANSVRDYLEMNGIASKRLTAVGKGDTNPVNTENTEAARAQNRRVELKIIR